MFVFQARFIFFPLHKREIFSHNTENIGIDKKYRE